MEIDYILNNILERNSQEPGAAYAEACRLKKTIKNYDEFLALEGFLRSMEHTITKAYMLQEGYIRVRGEWIKRDPEG